MIKGIYEILGFTFFIGVIFYVLFNFIDHAATVEEITIILGG